MIAEAKNKLVKFKNRRKTRFDPLEKHSLWFKIHVVLGFLPVKLF
jgi:hypothetical protein